MFNKENLSMLALIILFAMSAFAEGDSQSGDVSGMRANRFCLDRRAAEIEDWALGTLTTATRREDCCPCSCSAMAASKIAEGASFALAEMKILTTREDASTKFWRPKRRLS